MTGSLLDAAVTGFLDARIDDIPQLETLLLLHATRPASWTAERVAARIYLTIERAEHVLRQLQRRQLAEPGEGGGLRYDGRWDGEGLMDRVAEAYRRQLIAVTRHVHAKASSAVLNFARAFDLKKDR